MNLLLLLLAACGTMQAIPGPDTAVVVVVDSGEADPPVDTAPPPPPPVTDEQEEELGSAVDVFPPPLVTEETVGDYTVDDSWIFTNDTIHTINITLSTDAYNSLVNDPDVFAPATFEMDGITLGNVGMRLRGKIGSFRPITGKPKIKLDFNEFVPDQRFYGLESLALNSEVVDCGYLREPIAYNLFAAAGVPASRTGFAAVRVNGMDYGFYVVIEVPDDRFLAHYYPDGSGNLYDGKYIWYGGYSYTLLDFGRGVDHLFGLEEGVGTGGGQIADISGAMSRAWSSSNFYNDMDSVIDWDATLHMLAVEQYVGQNDGYAMNTNNYRVYFDPADGKAELIPWDMDYSSLQDYEWGRSWASPTGLLAYRCKTDPTCNAAWKVAAQDVTTVAEAMDVQGDINTYAAFIQSSIYADPRRECGASSISAYQDALRNFYRSRSAYMHSFWGF